MLNPSKEKRLSIEKVKQHNWIAGAFVDEYPPIDEKWKQKIYKAYSEQSKLSVDIVSDRIAKNPFGKMGGMFNIEKYEYQVEHMKVKKASSTGRIPVVKVQPMTPRDVSKLDRPITTINQQAASSQYVLRPRTARGGKTLQPKPFHDRSKFD